MMTTPSPIELARTPTFRLDGKRALVTGGGRGIGLAAAAALAEAGAQVTLAARTGREIEEAASAIRARGGEAEALVLDVTDIEAARRAVTVAAPPFQILVNKPARTGRPISPTSRSRISMRSLRSMCVLRFSWRRRWGFG